MTDKKPAPEAEAKAENTKARALTLSRFLPSDKDLAEKLISKGKGARLTVGRVFGIAMDIDRQPVEFQGQMGEKIVVRGFFQATSDVVTGGNCVGSSAEFPHLYAKKVGELFSANKALKAAKIDMDLVLEATGAKPAYKWVAVDYVEGDFDLLATIKERPAPK